MASLERTTPFALAISLALALAPSAARADTPLQVTASLSETQVVVGDVVTLEVSVVSHLEGAVEVAIPKIPGLAEVSRSKSESTSIQWGGGGQLVTKEYTVTLELEAQKDGKVTIPPIRAQVGRESAESAPLVLNVGGADEPSEAAAAAPGQVAPPGPGEERLFVRYRIDRSSAYVGEQILLDLEVYALPNLNLSIDEAAPPPSLDGFWREVLDQPQRLTRRIESIAGRSYHVYRVWRVALFPLEAGERTIPPAQLTFTLNRSIFGGGQRDRRRAPALKVEALPLPEGKPAGFSSQNVGEYRLTAAVDREKVPAGKALVLTLRLSGRGNIKNARLPELPEIPGFRSFAPTVQDQVEVTGEGFGGEKRADYLLMPERGGRLEIPPIELVVFDPAEKRYERLTTPSIRVAVEGEPTPGALAGTTEGVSAPPAPAPPPPPREQLRPLRFRSNLEAPRPPPWKNPIYPGLLAGPPLLFALYLSGEKLRARAARNQSGRAEEKAAHEASQRHLAAALEAARAGDAARAFREAQEALVVLASERSGVAIRGLTIDEARAALLARGAPNTWVEGLARELELADHARFGTAHFDRSALQTASTRWTSLFEAIDAWQPEKEAEA